MPMQIIRNDIVKVRADAIVNSDNSRPCFAPGVDERIYRAAGAEELLAEREKIGELACGEAAVTSAFNLPAKYIFHVSSPRWKGGNHNETALLRSCYDKVLALAVEYHCKSIAIPLLATGNFRFPRGLGLEIATCAIRDFLAEHELDIILVVYDRRSFTLSKELEEDVEAYIDEHYIGEHPSILRKRRNRRYEKDFEYLDSEVLDEEIELRENSRAFEEVNRKSFNSMGFLLNKKFPASDEPKAELKRTMGFQTVNPPWENFNPRTNSFATYLTQLLNRKGFDSNKEICNACGFDAKLLSKLLHSDYHTSKKTVMQLCIGLKLNLDESTDLMRQAGYAFNPNNITEVIVKYCIENQKDMFTTDEIVCKYTDHPLSNAILE